MVGFIYYDITFLVIFSLAVVIFLYKRRRNLKREGLMYLYRTKVGIKFINYIGGKYKRTLKILSYAAVVCGYFLMTAMIFLLSYVAFVYLKRPEIVKAIKIPPIMPLIPYFDSIFKTELFRPFYFTYWIIAIAVIAIFHEFAHGIFSKYNNINIKTTGFGFLGPFLAAFVEPDEEQMQKKSKFAQISILSAGTFVNFILAIFFFFLLAGFFVLTYAPAGAMFNTYIPGVVNVNEIDMINGFSVDNLNNKGLIDIIDGNEITNDLILGTNGNSLNFTKIIVGNKTYYITIDNLKEQLETEDAGYVVLYENLPAINAGLKGAIVEVDGNKIKTHEDLTVIMKNYKPKDEINIKTKFEGEILEYNLVLAEDINEKGRAIIGIGVRNSQTGFIGRIYGFFNFFERPATNYEPRFNTNLIVFIYNLIWWLALVNLSVALVNMLPMGIFDGGRMFMLTMWGITKSEKFGKVMYKIFTYLILGIFLLLMFSWAMAFF